MSRPLKEKIVIEYCAELGAEFLHITKGAAEWIDHISSTFGAKVSTFFYEDSTGNFMNLELPSKKDDEPMLLKTFYIENSCLYAV